MNPFPPSRIEPLEARIAPAAAATLIGKGSIQYTDIDGDIVTVALSKPLLTSTGTASSVFTFDSGGGVVAPGTATGPVQLTEINLAVLHTSGLGVTVSVKQAGKGDGFANVGYLDSIGFDVGKVAIKGDLGRIDAGTNAVKVPAVGSISVQSIGEFGTNTQTGLTSPSLQSNIVGSLASLKVASDIDGAFIDVTGSHGTIGSVALGGSLLGGGALHAGEIATASGSIGSVKIGGSVVGGATASYTGVILSGGKINAVTISGSLLGGVGSTAGTSHTGEIISTGDLGPVQIGGDMRANSYNESGKITTGGNLKSATISGSVIGGAGTEATGGSEGGQIYTGGNMGPITIGGSLIGGSGGQSAQIYATDYLGQVKIGGDVRGGAGGFSAYISAGNNCPGITISGSLVGGSSASAGAVNCAGNLGSVKIGHDVVGGSATRTGFIFALEGLGSATVTGSIIGGSAMKSGYLLSTASTVTKSIKVGGDLLGGTGDYSGLIEGEGGFGSVTISGSIVGAAGKQSGNVISSLGLGSLSIGGSLVAGSGVNNAAIIVDGVLGSVAIKGGVQGDSTHHASISAVGILPKTKKPPKADVAIGSVNVAGDVQFFDVLAGQDVSHLGVAAFQNGSASIGAVKIGGNFVASNVVAGAQNAPSSNTKFGDTNDAQLPTATAALLPGIGSLAIGGEALGTYGGSYQYGIVAKIIGAIKVGGSKIPLPTSTTPQPLGLTGDLDIHKL